MIINFDTITLSFLVVSAVTLAVVSVLVWYVYSSKRFRKDMISLMDEKLDAYLKEQGSSAKETTEAPQEEKPQEEQKELAGELPNIETKHE